MLVTKNLKYAEHDEFVDSHEEITTNEQPITMQSTRNIELIQEMPSSQSSLELLVIPQGKMHHLSLDVLLMLQHSSHDFIDVMGEALESYFMQCFPQTMRYHFSPQHAEYVKFGPREIFIDNEALQYQLMIMSSACCLTSTPGMRNTTHSETPLQSTLHANFIHEPHQVCLSLLISFQQSYNNHYKFYDRIESWLEESYTSALTMNNNMVKFNLLGGDLIELILPILHPSLLHFMQLNFNEHMIAGLELFDWLHWHYAYT
jgi:hypothetical protein